MKTEFKATIRSIAIKGPSDTLPVTTISPTFVVEIRDTHECQDLFGSSITQCIYGRDGAALVASIKPNIPLEPHVMRVDSTEIKCHPSFHQVDIKDGDVAVHIKTQYLYDGAETLTGYLISQLGGVITVALEPAQLELPGVVLDAEAAEAVEPPLDDATKTTPKSAHAGASIKVEKQYILKAQS